jgi:hypothetical protein
LVGLLVISLAYTHEVYLWIQAMNHSSLYEDEISVAGRRDRCEGAFRVGGFE